jgi:hypothetical protein
MDVVWQLVLCHCCYGFLNQKVYCTPDHAKVLAHDRAWPDPPRLLPRYALSERDHYQDDKFRLEARRRERRGDDGGRGWCMQHEAAVGVVLPR